MMGGTGLLAIVFLVFLVVALFLICLSLRDELNDLGRNASVREAQARAQGRREALYEMVQPERGFQPFDQDAGV